ncbi:hypothetical protein EVAR_7259_1 [Eumeta japonica]|uniref:Uncharacterized protein n=1 Tax=Eumeta variegata TaxID=151549 RepID=A0A4C1T381_EUMVA|nr:hypothetical protein EVAR_7259_1 [Eumeta japonica]
MGESSFADNADTHVWVQSGTSPPSGRNVKISKQISSNQNVSRNAKTWMSQRIASLVALRIFYEFNKPEKQRNVKTRTKRSYTSSVRCLPRPGPCLRTKENDVFMTVLRVMQSALTRPTPRALRPALTFFIDVPPPRQASETI